MNLHPELVRHIIDCPIRGRVIDHPLVNISLNDPGAIEIANEGFAVLCRKVEQALDAGKWFSYLFLHRRPYRLDKLIEVIDDYYYDYVPPKLWKVIGHVWRDTESVWTNKISWREIWENEDRSARKFAMSTYERKYLARQPEQLIVYRGVEDKAFVEGFSWTLDRGRAEWFARRWGTGTGQCYVAAGQVGRGDIIAYFKDRKEREIVVFPENVKNVELYSCQR